jgi:hypothetical protein
MGTCPYCQAVIISVSISEIQVNATVGGQTWRGIKYFCPTCDRVLSVAIDPVALNDELVQDIVEALGTH